MPESDHERAPQPLDFDMSNIPVTVLTGFLGSGKTTLLNRLLCHPGMARTAVIVNEFGAIGIDHHLVEASCESVMLLTNGCLCCALKSDLVTTLRDLYLRRGKGGLSVFDRVVIETTGLADPSSVIQVILAEPSIAAKYDLAGIVATIDAVLGQATLETHLEAAKQAALADRLVLTKLDLALEGTGLLKERLRALNPVAPILETAGEMSLAQLFGEEGGSSAAQKLAAGLPGMNAIDTEHSHRAGRISSFAFERDEPMSWLVLDLLLKSLIDTLGPRLLRLKGLVQIKGEPERPAVLHGAQSLLHDIVRLDRWPEGDRRSRLVFITLDSPKEESLELIDFALKFAERSERHAQSLGQAP
jgi:G3E family GTPase